MSTTRQGRRNGEMNNTVTKTDGNGGGVKGKGGTDAGA